MGNVWHFYNPSSRADWTDAGHNGADGTHYSFWFTDNGSGVRTATHYATAGGLPATGDTVYWDQGPAGVSADYHWSNMTIIGGTVDLSGSHTLYLDTGCVIAAGTTLMGDTTAMCLDNRATWLGDVSVVGFYICSITPGWKVNSGNAGGNISITGAGLGIYLYAPNAAQAEVYRNITLSMAAGGYTIDVHAMPAFSLTGQFAHSGESLWVPPVNAVTLIDSAAGYEVVKARASAGGMVTV
jgi:hypothetical protein